MIKIMKTWAKILSPIIGLPIFILHLWRTTSRSKSKYLSRKHASLAQYQEVMDWVKTQNLPLDTAREIPLPPHLAQITQKGTILVLHTGDSRHCILMKTWIFSSRENFWGTLYCDESLSERDFLPYQSDKGQWISFQGKYICVDEKGVEDYGLNFWELYVSKCHNEQLFEVYYTLN